MTLDQMMAWNGKIPLVEYEALLKKLESKKRSLARTCETVYMEDACLDVLSDEQGSERWLNHDKTRQAALAKKERLLKEIREIEEKINAC